MHKQVPKCMGHRASVCSPKLVNACALKLTYTHREASKCRPYWIQECTPAEHTHTTHTHMCHCTDIAIHGQSLQFTNIPTLTHEDPQIFVCTGIVCVGLSVLFLSLCEVLPTY